MLVQASGMEAWHDFFVAQVGATAALAGLLFVALSINVTQILKYSWLPARGSQTVVVLTGALFEASLALLPAPPVSRWAGTCALHPRPAAARVYGRPNRLTRPPTCARAR